MGQGRFLVSWWIFASDSAFELSSPWWLIVEDLTLHNAPNDARAIIAAVLADCAEEAKNKILDAFDVRPENLAWRKLEAKPADWSPFSKVFPRAGWMEWPTDAPDPGPRTVPRIDLANEATKPPDPETAPADWPEPREKVDGFFLYETDCSVCGNQSESCRDFEAENDTRRLVCLSCLTHRAKAGEWPSVKP